jgi:hypothetical protein
MKDALAERLLIRVMNWGAERVAEERSLLQDLANYKYDEYQQFSPGIRFIESLALWLNQFKTHQEREEAYQFIKEKLVFFSSAEIEHLIQIAYPDFIRPHLLRRSAKINNQNPNHFGRIVNSVEFEKIQRQCLFLGLSDGARIGQFRRANRDLNHEQISLTYQISDDQVDDLLEQLNKDISKINGGLLTDTKFTTIVLIDDFSGSGRSYYMPKENQSPGGKIAKFSRHLMDPDDQLYKLVDFSNLNIITLLYIATDQAREHIDKYSKILFQETNVDCQVEVVQAIPQSICVRNDTSELLNSLIQNYYDDAIYDRHMEKGETEDVRRGFADCSLPLVLHHNTPNNSIALLWSYEDAKIRGIFPRIRRHKEGI